jgi:hypothetical protein
VQKLYPNLTQEQYDAMKTTRNMTLESLKTTLGDQKFNSTLAKISAGAPYDPSMGTFEQYTAMRGYTAAGTQDWNRQLQGANMLLASNDPANIATAAKSLSTMFPGMSFSFDSLISDIGAEKFAKGMEQMATLSNTFSDKTWAEVRGTAEGLNLLKSMNIDDATAQQMFSGMKVNAIDKEWDTYEQSEHYQNMSDEDKSVLKDWFNAGLTGKLVFDRVPEYTVVDKDGRTVKKYSDMASLSKDYPEADLTKNGYTVASTERFVAKNMLTGEEQYPKQMFLRGILRGHFF